MLILTISIFPPNMNIIPITVAQPIHDLAITSVVPSVTSVMAGEPVNITVVVANQGTAAENFTVALRHDTTLIENKTATNIPAGTNTNIFFIWNTTDAKAEVYATNAKEKSYTIEAEASIVLGETETQNNKLTSLTPIVVRMHCVAIIPQHTVNFTITPGMNYTIAIYTDYNESDVWGWQFGLSYNRVLLEGIEVRNGDLITNTTANGNSARFKAGEFDNALGELGLTIAYFFYDSPPPPTTSGPGTLAYVTFRVKNLAESDVTLHETGETATRLIGYDAAKGGEYIVIDDITPDIFHVLGGYFRNTATPITHDIAVISVTPSSTSVTVGETVDITVVVKNNGTVGEGFDVAVYYDYDERFQGERVITTETVTSLEANGDKFLTVQWNTTKVQAGDHVLTALVPDVPGELNKINNKRESVTVTVKAKEIRPLPITEILVGVVVVAAVIVAIVLISKRRKKPSSEET